MRLYLASPLGFSEAGRHYLDEVLRPHFKAIGHQLINPFELGDQEEIKRVLRIEYGPAKRAAWQSLNPIIGENNRRAIDSSDGVFAILDGVDVDSGTASEIGYASAKGKRIWGYRGDFRLSADNEGSTVNMQVEYFITASGGRIFQKLADVTKAALAEAAAPR